MQKVEKKTYLVGGVVRDLLLKDTPKDLDYCVTGYTPEEFQKETGFKQVGRDFPVFLTPDGEEIALARTERSVGLGHNDFVVNTDSVTIEEDLERRDLTINSIAADYDGTIVDPFDGRKDLYNKILRHTSEASFSDDPLRILRLARFQTKYPTFRIHETTVNLINQRMYTLHNLTPERIRDEMYKALSYDNPSLFFRTLDFLGVLGAVFPELQSMEMSKQKPQHHAEGDVFLHSMMVLDEASKLTKDPDVRLAAMLHDICKPYVPGARMGYHHGHDSKELVKLHVDSLKRDYRLSNRASLLIKRAALYHMKLHKLSEMSSKKIAKMLNERTFPKTSEELEELLIIAKADAEGRMVIGKPKKVNNLDCITNVVQQIRAFSPAKDIEAYKKKHDKEPSGEYIYQLKHRYIIKCVEAYIRPFFPKKKRERDESVLRNNLLETSKKD